MLSKLKIKCYYQQNGCPDILNYEALKQHEINCDYEIKKCRGCNTNFIKRDIIEHENICGFIKIRCQQCGVTYERHTEHGKLDCLLNRQIQLEEKVEQLQQENKLLREKNEFILQKLKDRFGIQPPK
ncbi:unnamed protein product [Didymodactylos carnosus]|nr:unnamed protein product [Didymodactylos carnosus]CAF3889773.1 unnamed protein product [Didymodactylos carnosus]